MMNNEDEEAAWLELERKLKKIDLLVGDLRQIAGTEPQPVAWRKNVNGIWHYFDKSTPFNTDDLEPLFLRNSK